MAVMVVFQVPSILVVDFWGDRVWTHPPLYPRRTDGTFHKHRLIFDRSRLHVCDQTGNYISLAYSVHT